MNDIIWFTETSSPLGKMILTATDRGLCGVYFEGQRYIPTNCSTWQRNENPFMTATTWLQEYFSGEDPIYPGALDLRGTEFQKRVWRALQAIAFGSSATYQQIATAIGRSTAARAVGAAIGRNPISLIIPCHRVVGSQGGLTGYAGGLERKEYLLHLERRGEVIPGSAGIPAGK